MRSFRLLLFIALSVCAVSNANADLYTYSWSGWIEDIGPTNPWALAGDGSVDTRNDGSTFTFNVVLDSAALDISPNNNQSRFDVTNTTEFRIDGSLLQITNAHIFFFDSIDAIQFQASGTRLGTNLGIVTAVVIPGSTFEMLDDNSPDAPPLFLPTFATSNATGLNSDTIYTFTNAGASVTAVPEPASLSLMGFTVAGAALLKRYRCKRSLTRV